MGSSRLTNILIGIAIITVLVFVFFYFRGDSSLPSSLTTATNTANNSAENAQFLQALLSLRKINLDDSILDDNVFKKLEDFSPELVSEAKGRANPFLPLGVDAAVTVGESESVPQSAPTQ